MLPASSIIRSRSSSASIIRQKTKITEFDEADVRELIQKITVFPVYFTVEFKSGISVYINE